MIVKRLYLNMENWSVSRGSYQLGYIAENTVTRLQIATDIDPNCTYHLEHEINGESYILYLEQGDGVLTATIPNTMLTKVGNANWQIVGIWADESVKKSNVFNVYISNAINAENEVPASEITAFTAALADLAGHMSEVAGYAESASASANEASDYAENASVSAEGAATSAENASASAESASTSAQNASASAESASTSAQNAATSAESANTSATNASTSASEASASASEASTSAENAATSAANASASASEASTHASNASASATTATEQASLASSSATSAQTYASNASTSEQNCATYASNARASAEEAQEYVESLDNWTTVEFSLADFTYDKNSGVTYLRTEAPSGYEIAEVRGYLVLNKSEAGDAAYSIAIDIAPANDFRLLNHVLNTGVPTSALGYAAIFNGSVNDELKYISSQNVYRSVASNINWSDSNTLSSSSITGRSINNTFSDLSGVNLKTDIPYTNIREFYGKLQYRVKPTT